MNSYPIHFKSFSPMHSYPKNHVVDGSVTIASHIGSIKTTNGLFVPEVFFVPQLSTQFLSVGQLCDIGLIILFYSSSFVVHDCSTGKQVGTGHRVGRLYVTYILQISP